MVDDEDALGGCCNWATVGGMPFIRNSTATSGLPWAARRQARASASGNPIPVRFEMTSAGNSSEEDVVVEVVADVCAGIGAGAGTGFDVVDEVEVDVVVAGVNVSVDVVLVDSVVLAVEATGAGAGAGNDAGGAAAFFFLPSLSYKLESRLV